MTSGHSEWINFNNTTQLQNLLALDGFQTLNLGGSITSTSLFGIDVLIIGNAWGTVSASEIAAIHSFVMNGGALFMVGLGWSYEAFSGPLPDFPMNQIASPMGVEWISGTINDPVNQFNGSPLFRYFYPYISMRSPCNIAVDAVCAESEVFIHQVDDPLYQAEDFLHSDAYVPCDATFRSSQYIELVPGFEVPADVNFLAEMEECF